MKILISILMALGGLLALSTLCKAQCDSSSISLQGDKVLVSKQCWNTIANEYNRLKLESAEAKKLIKSDSLVKEGLNKKVVLQDSLLVLKDSTNIILKNENLKLSKPKPTKGLWFGLGVITTIALKLLLW
ncbi:MAG: hypothetical protein RLZZ175_3029 [Bacteroidota bacterium]|jgi:hypothetical protein